MYAEVSTMHMLSICAEWTKDEMAALLWSEADKASVYNWCRETRGRLPNLDKITSGGGQIFKLVQILDNSNPLVIQRLRSSDVVQQNPKPDLRAWIAPLAAHVVEQATLAQQREREDEEDEFLD